MSIQAVKFPTARVVDLSHYNDVQDKFKGAVGAGIWGVINKASEGDGGHDDSFNWRREPARAAGLEYGAYHFMRPGPVQAQAAWYLSRLSSTTGLLLALDHEDARVPLASAKLWLQIVADKVGRMPVLYSGFLVKQQIGARPDPFWKGVRLWLCHYAARPTWPKPWTSPWLIQYSGDGKGPAPHGVPGIVIHTGAKSFTTNIDMNHYAGARDDLRREWAS